MRLVSHRGTEARSVRWRQCWARKTTRRSGSLCLRDSVRTSAARRAAPSVPRISANQSVSSRRDVYGLTRHAVCFSQRHGGTECEVAAVLGKEATRRSGSLCLRDSVRTSAARRAAPSVPRISANQSVSSRRDVYGLTRHAVCFSQRHGGTECEVAAVLGTENDTPIRLSVSP